MRQVEVLLKGPEIKLPAEFHCYDKEQIRHTEARFRWRDRSATTLKSAAIGVGGSNLQLPEEPIDCSHYHYLENTPIFFGHYWLSGEPRIESDNALCFDHSVAKGGKLVGYQWNPYEPIYGHRIVFQRSKNSLTLGL
ncbi:MAG: hypothetical protein WCO61_05775 [Alphaproteobacteria bacterium]